MSPMDRDISVLCVDDNRELADALKRKMDRVGGFVWKGWLASADNLVEAVRELSPQVVVLDLDMPGLDPFSALRALAEGRFDSRVIVFSGHVRGDLLDRAIEGGVWGYVAKSDGEAFLLSAIPRVMAGECILSPSVRADLGP